MSKRKAKETTPADKTQHGDPPPAPEVERQGTELTPDELVGKSPLAGAPSGYMPTAAQRAAVKEGPIAPSRVCAECRRPVADVCTYCAPKAKVAPIGGANAIDPTARTETPLSREFNYRMPFVRV